MDVIYKLETATASEIHTRLHPQPSYSTVRAQLRVLEQKGHVRHEEQGLRYTYFPTISRRTARRSALRHVVETFFEGSAGNAVAALLGSDGAKLSADELERVSHLIEEARKRGT
jgi:BlaI family penicillinase repressor